MDVFLPGTFQKTSIPHFKNCSQICLNSTYTQATRNRSFHLVRKCVGLSSHLLSGQNYMQNYNTVNYQLNRET